MSAPNDRLAPGRGPHHEGGKWVLAIYRPALRATGSREEALAEVNRLLGLGGHE